jgi:hypothetical protein
LAAGELRQLILAGRGWRAFAGGRRFARLQQAVERAVPLAGRHLTGLATAMTTARRAPRVGGAEPAASAEPSSGLPPQLAKILGAVVAPATFLSALLYYFGWSHAYWFCNYFGVNSTVLGFTTTDYLMRSVDALFVPMTVVAAAAMAAAWGHSLLQSRLADGSWSRVLARILPAVALAGGALFLGGFISVLTPTVLTGRLVGVAAPLCLGGGVLLLVYAVHLRRFIARPHGAAAGNRRWASAVEWIVVFVLVSLSLFWAATDYSAAVGTSRAIDFVAGMASYPDVVLYSEHSLSLTGPGVTQTQCRDADAAYRFRYGGLKLVLESGGQYFFLPAGWTRASGEAIPLPQDSSIRLEFAPVRTASGLPPTPPPSC